VALSQSCIGVIKVLPNCVILGAQKSGSTFLHRCLGDHPQVYSPQGEVHFFEDPNYREDRIGELEKLLEPGKGKQIVAIKRPKYLSRPECPERIARHCPDARLLVVLRNPVERAMSAYFHYVNYGFIPAINIERGMKAILEDQYRNSYPGGRDVIQFGFYHKYLSRYLHYFDRDKICITLFDDIRKNGLDAVQKVYSYLGISASFVPPSLDSRPQAVVYSLPRLRVRRFRNPFVYLYDQTRSSTYRKRPTVVSRAVDKFVLGLDQRVLKPIFRNQKPVISEGLKKTLIETYQEDIENLETLLGRDLSNWKQ
jgi:Sulfotransferase domain